MREEEFPVSPDKAEKLAEVLAKGKREDKLSEKRAVYVNLSMVRLQLGWVMPKLLYAKGVADAAKLKGYVICWNKNRFFNKIVNSLGFETISLEEILRRDPAGALSALAETISFIIADGSGEGLIKLRYCGVNAGKYLYEDIIRTSSLSTIRSARNKICIRKMLHLLWMEHALQKILKKDKPVYTVADDLAYHEAMQLCLFNKFGSKIRNVSSGAEDEVFFDEKGQPLRRGGWIHDCIKEQLDEVPEAATAAEELLAANFAGISGRAIDRGAFKGKEILSRKDITEKLGLDPSKKNAVIMAHTFTDAVFNYGDLYFRDYYDWLDQTLKIAEEVDSVNWILKPHPTRKAYNEETDSIEKMFERHKKPHMFLLPDEISAGSIKELADVLLTIGGNAGAEFACFGIPPVIVGKPYYREFGFTLEPSDLEEYIAALKNIAEIGPLNEDQIRMARKVYYYKKKGRRYNKPFGGEFALKINGLYKEMADKMGISYFMSNKGTKEYNDAVCDYMTSYVDAHGIRDNEYYLRGLQRGEELQI